MPLHGALLLSDLHARWVGIACERCRMERTYYLPDLVDMYGPDASCPALLDVLAVCTVARGGWGDRCSVRYAVGEGREVEV